VHRIADIEASLKWPNDLIVPGDDMGAGYGLGRKLGGILCQRGPGDRDTGGKPYADKQIEVADSAPGAAGTAAIVIGVGLNVTLRAKELPVPHATSIALVGGAVTDRDTLLRALLRDFGSSYAAWAAAAGDPERSGVADAYRAVCSTLGTAVRAEMPGGGVVSGMAQAIDDAGRLVVLGDDGSRMPIAAGDVVHLR
jgi:BirA family biotin operon repressor/biotin-[acetyl-CoA-carboxylase] ligase